jgi:hypothetical protein
MSQSRLGTLLLKLDDWRVRQHFKRVEGILRARDVSHLPPTLQQAREHYLDRLYAYAVRGVFPRNYERPGYAPCFIDREGRECAVAHLLMFSGHVEVAKNIAAVANYAYVPQMTFPELDDWAAQAGLSREELALIQPGYYLPLTGWYLSVAIAAWAAGLVTILINAVQIARRRKGIIAPVMGFIVASFLLLMMLSCLNDWAAALEMGRKTPDHMAFDFALRDAGPLGLGVLISLVLVVITLGLSVYRMQAFIDARRKNRQGIVGDKNSLP